MNATVEIEELPAFRSVNQALSFALNFKHGSVKATGLAVLMAGAKKPGRGLTGLDGAGTAGFVRAEIKALPAVRGAILIARYAVRALPCECKRQCCSGFRSNTEWLESIAVVTEAVRTEALSGCSSNFLLRNTMVRRYFGTKVGLSDAAKAAGVDKDTASSHAGKVISYLRAEERVAMYAIEGALKSMGIVE